MCIDAAGASVPCSFPDVTSDCTQGFVGEWAKPFAAVIMGACRGRLADKGLVVRALGNAMAWDEPRVTPMGRGERLAAEFATSRSELTTSSGVEARYTLYSERPASRPYEFPDHANFILDPIHGLPCISYDALLTKLEALFPPNLDRADPSWRAFIMHRRGPEKTIIGVSRSFEQTGCVRSVGLVEYEYPYRWED